MSLRRLALVLAAAAPFLAPLASAPPAAALHCPPGTQVVTGSLYFNGFGPAADKVVFVARDPLTGAICITGRLSGHCPAVTVLADSSTMVLAANAWDVPSQSCITGATKLTVVAWTP